MSRYTPAILGLAFSMVLTLGERALALTPSEVGVVRCSILSIPPNNVEIDTVTSDPSVLNVLIFLLKPVAENEMFERNIEPQQL